MVSSRYSTDDFVSVWYHYYTDSGNLEKSFDAYFVANIRLECHWWSVENVQAYYSKYESQL
jgi:hypothetical protein